MSNALVVSDQRPANGSLPTGKIKMPLASHNMVRNLTLALIYSLNDKSHLDSQAVTIFGIYNGTITNLYLWVLIIWILQEIIPVEPGIWQANGVISRQDSLTAPPAPDLLGDLLGPLAIEAPPGPVDSTQSGSLLALEVPTGASDPLALVIHDEESTSVQVFMLLIVQICEA